MVPPVAEMRKSEGRISGENQEFSFRNAMFGGPAVSIMAMSLDSHVVDCGSSLGPGGLKLTPGMCACMAKIPRREWRRDCGVAISPGG